MKRVGYLYDKLCDKNLISYAFDKAVKGKKKKRRIAKYINRKDEIVDAIYEMFVQHAVVFGETHKITIHDKSCGKEREITVPSFYPDQIIHWCVITVLKPIMKRGMYQYSCGSIDGRGGIYAKEFTERVLREYKPRYVLKMDISKFFPSINTDKLLRLFEKKIKDMDMLLLISKILVHGGNGLPIGFYTSQWFSNFYLEELDHYIKEVLKINHYVRYVDDLVLFSNNRRTLRRAECDIENWLIYGDFNVIIKNNWQIWKTSERPIDFVGFRFFLTFTKLRKRIFFRLLRAVNTIKLAEYCCISLARRVSSLLGWLTHINARVFYCEHIRPIIGKSQLAFIIRSAV